MVAMSKETMEAIIELNAPGVTVGEQIMRKYYYPDGVRKMRGRMTRRQELVAIAEDIDAALKIKSQTEVR